MKNKAAIILAAALLVALLSFGAFFLGARYGNDEMPASQPEVSTQAEESAESPSISIPGYDVIRLQARQTSQSVEFYNPEGNPCYFTIALLLPDGAEIFKSGLLSPGSSLESIELIQPLEAGSYEGAKIRYSCFRLEDMQQMSGADVIMKLEVEP